MRARTGFTLIELLIVVGLLGILAALVVPRFGDASAQARESALLRQLQSVRQTIERFNFENTGYPPDVVDGTGWDDLVGAGYLINPPRNPERHMATGIVSGTAAPGTASGAAATDGWYWNTDRLRLYAIDTAGNIIEG